MPRALIVAILVVLPACDRFPWERGQEAVALDPAVIERVVQDVLARLTAAHEETGTHFIERIPQIKEDAAAHEGFEGWKVFQRDVRMTDPDLQFEISRRITERIQLLLETRPEETPADENG